MDQSKYIICSAPNREITIISVDSVYANSNNLNYLADEIREKNLSYEELKNNSLIVSIQHFSAWTENVEYSFLIRGGFISKLCRFSKCL